MNARKLMFAFTLIVGVAFGVVILAVGSSDKPMSVEALAVLVGGTAAGTFLAGWIVGVDTMQRYPTEQPIPGVKVGK